MKQAMKQSMRQSIKQSIKLSMKQTIKQSMKQSMKNIRDSDDDRSYYTNTNNSNSDDDVDEHLKLVWESAMQDMITTPTNYEASGDTLRGYILKPVTSFVVRVRHKEKAPPTQPKVDVVVLAGQLQLQLDILFISKAFLSSSNANKQQLQNCLFFRHILFAAQRAQGTSYYSGR